MSKNKFYAVRKGKIPGIYYSWDECKEQVEGYSGAEYKGFQLSQDADEYMKNSKANKIIVPENETAIAYVDGSYNPDTKEYACGVVLFFNEKTFEISKKNNNMNLVSMRNVAGELMGAINAIKFAIEKNAKKIIIYYDYAGIEKWACGEWKTNKEGTKKYKEFIDSIKNKIIVEFEKVKAHTGDEYNERADKLAKKALGIYIDNNMNEKELLENLEIDLFVKQFPEIIDLIKEYIRKYDYMEEFDIIDIFIEENSSSFINKNEKVIMDIFFNEYEKAIRNNNVKII